MKGQRISLAVLTIGLLVAGSCSSDRGSEQSDTPTDTAAAGDFGDLEGLCGPQTGGGTVPDAGPEETLGVTEDTITVGTLSDPGFDGRPGLNQEIFDAGEAFVAWCNAAGGINGRQIELNLHDAAVVNYSTVMGDACDADFALVGSGAVQDDQWPEVGAACGLIDIAGFSVTRDKAGLAGQDPFEVRSVQPLPNPGDRYRVGGYRVAMADQPEVAARAGIIYADLGTVIQQRDRIVGALEPLGYDFVYDAAYNTLGESNWSPFAAAIAEADVGFFLFVGEGDNIALLLQAMHEVGYRPDVVVLETNLYDQSFLDAAGSAADGVLVRTPFWPFEEADRSPATRLYLDLLEASGGKVTQLGTQAMSAWALFAQAVGDCDRADDLTRTCVLEAAAAVEDWTGGGLHAPTNPGANEPTACTILVEIQDGAFTRAFPEEGYDCGEDADEPYVVDVDL